MDDTEDNILEAPKLSTVTKFKDSSRRKRSVSGFSWKTFGVRFQYLDLI